MDSKMETLGEIVNEPSSNFNSGKIAERDNVSNEPEKRPHEESAEGNEREPKKCKTDNGDDKKEPILPVISKRQLKLAEKQKKWLEQKEERKKMNKIKKLKHKKLLAEQRESGVVLQSTVRKRTKMADSKCKQRIVLDMAYDNLMKAKDLSKCSSQILRCYGMNRRMENPMQFYICCFDGIIKETMAKHNGSESWDIHYEKNSIDKVFKKEEMVYLTSDSLNVLDSFDETKVYIIGGLVDHNAFKGASLKAAENLGIAHAKLPIDKYISMQSRKILTINQVFEIISKVVAGESWKEAFISTIPKRKMFSLMDELDSTGENGQNTNEEDKDKEDKTVLSETNPL